ncbi:MULTISPECIES: hypothetical protein [unclassified Paenibacillus]|uniref:hypothetical protein n=1 Tax=unclassified Paenibacillus TaxID=185978 RepID=UPI001180A229|nr:MULTISPECIES: hypothetical protein [unclassified Paenibacillus]
MKGLVLIKKLSLYAFSFALIVSLSLSSVVLAAPIDNSTLRQVQTSGADKTWVGEWQGEDTIIVDSLGNVTTSGELKKTSSLVFPTESTTIRDVLIQPDLLTPTFELPNESFATLASDYGHAWPYSAVNSSAVNCYGYATKAPWKMNPGDGDGVSKQIHNILRM